MMAPPTHSEIEAARLRLARVKARIEAACRRADRDPSEVSIIGACKRQSLERISALVAAGLDQLGQNYVQEAQSLQPALATQLEELGVPQPRFRMIGHLQRNKARPVVEIFDAVDTVDRASLAVELNKRAAAIGKTLEVSLQINQSGEPQKSGAAPEEAEALLEACTGLANLQVVGLMTMPAADPEAAREAFAQLRALRDTLHGSSGGASLVELNMGMSGDFEIAVEEGATQVRIGTALFGERAPR